MGSTMFFGTLYDTQTPGTSTTSTNARMQLVPAPDPGVNAGSTGYSELLEFENGGSAVVRSAARRRTYSMDWNLREASGAAGLDIIRDYSEGYYGPGKIYFSDPMIQTENVLDPRWATPALIYDGWKNITVSTPSWNNQAAGVYNQPRRYPTWAVAGNLNFNSGTGNFVPPTDPAQIMVIPIPPGHTLRLGGNGAASSGVGIAIRGILLDGSTIYVGGAVVGGGMTASNNIPSTFNGNTYKAVELFIANNSSTPGTLSLLSMDAKIHPNTITPVTSGLSHVPGRGHNGLSFVDATVVESYVLYDGSGSPRHYKGSTAEFTETGLWDRPGT